MDSMEYLNSPYKPLGIFFFKIEVFPYIVIFPSWYNNFTHKNLRYLRHISISINFGIFEI